MSHVVILGAGVMGTALTVPLSDNGHRIDLIGTHLDEAIIDDLIAGKPHPRLGIPALSGVTPHRLDRFPDVVSSADLVILGVSSPGIPWASCQLARALQPRASVVSVTKGMAAADGGLRILPAELAEGLPAALSAATHLAAIGGPCIAAELAARRPTSIVLAGPERETLQEAASILATPYYHVHLSRDLTGVEVCAAFKNFYAIAVGWARGLSDEAHAGKPGSHNPAAALFAQAVDELGVLVRHWGGDRASAWRLPGAGDLYVTSQSGRNSRFGTWLGRGASGTETRERHMAGETVEGVELALAVGPTLESLMGQGDLAPADLPLMTALLDTILRDRPFDPPWNRFAGAG